MKVKESLREIRERLSSASIEEAILESELIIRHSLCLDTAGFLLNLNDELSPQQKAIIDDFVARRLNGEPIAYIVGKREFYGYEFCVNPSVLIPRPETEHLVEKALEIVKGIEYPIIADIGTGSGAISATLAAELPNSKIYAIDISYLALDTARLNARRHGVEGRITFLQGDLTRPLPEAVDILIANLPYVKSVDCADSQEPHLALDGGIDGLDVIKRLSKELKGKIKPGGSVLLEIGLWQAQSVRKMLLGALPHSHIEIIKDLAGIERVVWVKLD
jgi:release factor glutamine methyltransferase